MRWPRRSVHLCVLFLLASVPLRPHDSRGQDADAAGSDQQPSITLIDSADDPSLDLLQPFRAQALEKWDKQIREFEARDALERDPPDAILFVGSSSIRRWNRISTDMAPYRTIRRGFGGSKYSDVAVFAERLLHPHQYRALVMFVGNDVSGKPTDHTPRQVERLVRHILAVSHGHRPDAPVLMIEVTPTEKRFTAWPRIRALNARLREIALTTPHTYFVATAGHLLDPLGRPRGELFADDNLHLNEDGYALWAELIRRRLDEVFRMTEEFHTRQAPASAGGISEK